jgi:tetratricopeptide (TPR) repeat protein
MTFATEKLIGWEHQVGAGYDLARTGNYKHAFKILDNAFAMLGQFLQKPEPALFIYVTTNALIDNPDIGQRLLSYAAEMSKVKLSARHPLTLVWDMLSKAGLQQLKVSGWAMLLSYLDTLEQLFGKSQQNLPFIKYWLLNDAFFSGLVDKDECCARLRSTIEQSELLGQRTHALQAKSIIVNILVRANEHREARPILEQIIEENHKTGEIFNMFIEEQSRFQRFVIYKNIESMENTIKAGRDCLQFLKKYKDPGYPFTVYAASVLRDYLEVCGIPIGTEKLEEFLDPDWDAFCRGLDIL